VLASSRRVKKGPGRRPLSAKRQKFMELRERGWSIRAAAREVGVSRSSGNNWASGQKVYRKGEVVGFVPPLDRLLVRRISARFLSQDERIEIADLRRAGLGVDAGVDAAADGVSEGADSAAEEAASGTKTLGEKAFSSKTFGVRSKLFGNDGINYNPATRLSVGGDLNGARAGIVNARGIIRIGWSVAGRGITGNVTRAVFRVGIGSLHLRILMGPGLYAF